MKNRINQVQLSQLIFLTIERSAWEVADHFVIEKGSAIASLNRFRAKGWVTSRRGIVTTLEGRYANGKLYTLTQEGREAMRKQIFLNADRATRKSSSPSKGSHL